MAFSLTLNPAKEGRHRAICVTSLCITTTHVSRKWLKGGKVWFMLSDVQGGSEGVAILMEQECVPVASHVSVDPEIVTARLGLRHV